MLQNWDAFFKWFTSLTLKISVSSKAKDRLVEIHPLSDSGSYLVRRQLFSEYIGLLIGAVITEFLKCSVPKLAGIIGCSKQRLYRIENGQVIHGLYEIFCILYAAGLPFPDCFELFVSERLSALRKNLTSLSNNSAVKSGSSISSSDASVPSVTDISNDSDIHSTESDLLSNGHTSSKDIVLNVSCSENGDLAFRLSSALFTPDLHTDLLSYQLRLLLFPSSLLSEERTGQNKKSAIRDTVPQDLAAVHTNIYHSLTIPSDLSHTFSTTSKETYEQTTRKKQHCQTYQP